MTDDRHCKSSYTTTRSVTPRPAADQKIYLSGSMPSVRSSVRSLAGSLYDRRASRILQQELAVAYIKSRRAYNGSVAATKVRPLNDNKSRPPAAAHWKNILNSDLSPKWQTLHLPSSGTGAFLFTAILGILMAFGSALVRTSATCIMAYSSSVYRLFGTGDSVSAST